MNNPLPDPDLVGDLFWGIFKPQLIRLALQTDIFTPLASGPQSSNMSLAQVSPTVRITCLDTPGVLQVARDLAERLQVSSQANCRPADLLDADLREKQYDAALLGQITHYLTEAQNRDLFRCIHRALTENGIWSLIVPCLRMSPLNPRAFSRYLCGRTAAVQPIHSAPIVAGYKTLAFEMLNR